MYSAQSIDAFLLKCSNKTSSLYYETAFFESFGNKDPWAKEGTTGEDAVEYFNMDIIGMDTIDVSVVCGRILASQHGLL